MTPRLVDAMSDAAPWVARGPEGSQPSAAITLDVDRAVFRLGDDRASLRVTVAGPAGGHRVRRSLAAIDLAAFDELRLWLRCSRVADGGEGTPFLLELRLGSAAAPIGAAGNPWVRRLPVRQKDQWELVRVGLADLPAAVRTALTEIELRCLAAPVSYVYHLDSLLAVKDEFLVDVEASLVGALDKRIRVDDQEVAAAVVDPDVAQPEPPCIRIVPGEIRHYPALSPQAPLRVDYSAEAFRLLLPPQAYGLTYELEPRAGTRAGTLRILDFLLRTLSPHAELPVNGVPLPIEWRRPRCSRETDAAVLERPRLRIEVRAWQQRGEAQPVRPPFGDLKVEADMR